MTMHVNLSPEMEGFIRNKVASGSYGNATEVIRDAIRSMQARETRIVAWQAAIKLGDEQLDRGEAVPYTAGALKEITQTAISRIGSGGSMDPDVLP